MSIKEAASAGLKVGVGVVVALIFIGIAGAIVSYIDSGSSQQPSYSQPTSNYQPQQGWTQAERNIFTNACVTEAGGGQFAQDYCGCIQREVESQYTVQEIEIYAENLDLLYSDLVTEMSDCIDFASSLQGA